VLAAKPSWFEPLSLNAAKSTTGDHRGIQKTEMNDQACPAAAMSRLLSQRKTIQDDLVSEGIGIWQYAGTSSH
jgi:hypothetical protein